MHALAMACFSACRLRLLLIRMLLAGAVCGCSQSEEDVKAPPPTPPALQASVYQVGAQAWPQLVATQGNLVADETTVIGAKVAGRIDQVSVDLGDFVKAGTVLASLDRQELQQRVGQAEAELAQSRAAIGLDPEDDLDSVDPLNSPVVAEQKALWDQALADRDRVHELRSRQATTAAQYEAVLAAEQAAKARHAAAINSVRQNIALVRVRAAQLELAKQLLADAEIRAPFDGRVQDRHVSPGTFVQIGDSIVTLMRDDPLRYRGSVPETFAANLAIGQSVRLRVSSGPELPEVTISRISPTLDPFSRSLLFEASVPNTDHAVQAGLFCQGEVQLNQPRQTVALPRSAIVSFAGTQKVWKVVDGRAIEQPIETGARLQNLVEVISGVKPGDQVLLEGAKGRSAKVEIREVVRAGTAVEEIGSRPIAAPRS